MALDKNEARLEFCAESHVRRMDSTSTPLRQPSVSNIWESAAAWNEIQHGIRSSVKHFNIRRFYLHPNVGLWNWTNTIKWQILKTSGLMFKNKSRRWITTPQAAHCTFFFFLIVLFHGFPCGLSQATQMKQKLKVREFIVSASDFVLHRNWIWNLYFACCANRQVWMLVCVYFLCASTPSRIVILTDPLDLV